MFNIENYLRAKQVLINKALDKYLPGEQTSPQIIHRAMRYSVLAGGKRLRPILTLATGEMLGARTTQLLPVACSIELVHTDSLIHDDLPFMDNADLRRGQPTCHKVFGEALAILAGDALLPLAFKLIADEVLEKKLAAQLMAEIAGVAGSKGMVGGQVMDIYNQERPENIRGALRQMYLMKTTGLITAAVRSGALVAGASSRVLNRLSHYGRNLGLAFQVTDDILDIKGAKLTLGKTPGKDRKLKKLTYPAVYGLEKARAKARYLIRRAKQAIEPLEGESEILSLLADYIVNRKH